MQEWLNNRDSAWIASPALPTGPPGDALRGNWEKVTPIFTWLFSTSAVHREALDELCKIPHNSDRFHVKFWGGDPGNNPSL